MHWLQKNPFKLVFAIRNLLLLPSRLNIKVRHFHKGESFFYGTNDSDLSRSLPHFVSIFLVGAIFLFISVLCGSFATRPPERCVTLSTTSIYITFAHLFVRSISHSYFLTLPVLSVISLKLFCSDNLIGSNAREKINEWEKFRYHSQSICKVKMATFIILKAVAL